MTFLQMKYFLAVMESNSISKAAENQYVSRTAISRTLRELEEEFDVPLFERTIDGVKVTPAGKVVYERFSEIQHRSIALENQMDELRKKMTEKEEWMVKLCITPITVRSIFPGLYRAVKEQYPDIDIVTTEADHLQAKSMMEEGTLDFQLTSDASWSASNERADRLVFYRREYVLCMAPWNPLAKREYLTIEDLRDEPIVFFDQHYTYRSHLEDMFSLCGITPKVAMRTYQLMAVREAVRRGFGCTAMPKGGLDNGEDIVCVPLRPQVIWDTALIWNPHVPHNTAFHNLLDAARQWQAKVYGEVTGQ